MQSQLALRRACSWMYYMRRAWLQDTPREARGKAHALVKSAAGSQSVPQASTCAIFPSASASDSDEARDQEMFSKPGCGPPT